MKKLITLTAITAGLFLPSIISAQVNLDSGYGTTFGVGTADLESTVVEIVQWVLGFLGLIALIMIIAAVVIGATTSDADKAARARKALLTAIVGLVIILIAWAIVTFVVARTTDFTT